MIGGKGRDERDELSHFINSVRNSILPNLPSINKIPPLALLIASTTFGAVPPTNRDIKLAAVVTSTSDRGNKSKFLNIFPNRLAIVVLPVP